MGTKNTDSKFKKISLKDDNNSYEKLISSYDHTFKGNESELNSVTDCQTIYARKINVLSGELEEFLMALLIMVI